MSGTKLGLSLILNPVVKSLCDPVRLPYCSNHLCTGNLLKDIYPFWAKRRGGFDNDLSHLPGSYPMHCLDIELGSRNYNGGFGKCRLCS